MPVDPCFGPLKHHAAGFNTTIKLANCVSKRRVNLATTSINVGGPSVCRSFSPSGASYCAGGAANQMPAGKEMSFYVHGLKRFSVPAVQVTMLLNVFDLAGLRVRSV